MTEKREQAPALYMHGECFDAGYFKWGPLPCRVSEDGCPKMKKAGEQSPAVETQLSTETTIHELSGLRQAKLSDGSGSVSG